MTSLTFYGGINEIGGTKIVIEDNGTKLLFDFGIPFDRQDKPISDIFWMPERYLTPRSLSYVRDMLEFGQIPRIPGLYSKEDLDGTNMKYKKPDFAGVFCTHAHFDHVGYLKCIDETIPVHVGECTKTIMEVIEAQGNTKYGKHKYKTFRTGEKIKFDSLTVVPVHVDHSIPAAYGYIIETPGGAIAYTGDLRMHGPRADMTHDFIEVAREHEPVALITEATRVGGDQRKNYSEEHVRSESLNMVKKTDKLVCVAHYPRDVDRLRTFYEIAEESGRQMVVSMKTAHLLDSLKKDKKIKVPSTKDMIMYKTGAGKEYTWNKPYLDTAVRLEDLRKRQGELILSINLSQLSELIDLRPEPGSHFIHSMSEPFSDEDISDEVLDNWMRHFGMTKHQLHASGHCSREDLKTLIETINPKVVYPVHTEHSKEVAKLLKNSSSVRLGEYGKRCNI